MRKRRFTALAVMAVLAAGVAIAGAESASGWETDRIAGADRYDTAAQLSARVFPNGATDVVVASGESFADALAAAPGAARRHGPLLLTRMSSVPGSTADELRRLHPSRIVLAGGTAAVSASVEYALGTIAPVTRVAGADRFETATKLADESYGTGVPAVYLANGRTFPDALAAGAVAGRLGVPVLLVERTTVPAVVRDALGRLRPARIVLVGGTAVLSDALRDALSLHQSIDRVAGADRYGTAAALAAEIPEASETGLVASGENFPDALSAGAGVAALGATFALTSRDCLPTASAQGMVDDGVHQILVVGGEAAVPEAATNPCEPVTTNTTAPATTTTTSGGSGGGGGGGGGSSGTTTTTVALPPTPTIDVQSALTQDSPDPAVLRTADGWYSYSTQVAFLKVPVRFSETLDTWTEPADAMPALPSWAEFGANWAPSVTDVGDGSYVLWYAARDAASGRQCVSRAIADDPSGPFVDELDEPAVCQLTLGGSIDPFVFTDTDGSRWLYWKSDENALGKRARLWVAELSEDAATVVGTPKAILRQDRSWESPTIEQPAVVRVGGDYYLFYSGGWWESTTYAIGFAVGTSPTGPFTKVTTSKGWLRTSAGASGPGALDVFVGPDDELWAAFHAWPGTVGYADGGMRTTRLPFWDSERRRGPTERG